MIVLGAVVFFFRPARQEATIGAAPHPSLPGPVVPEGFGVNIHFTEPKPGELEMIAAAGFKWVRMDVHWENTEKQRGVYDFSAYDRLVAALEKHGLRALFILCYGNPLYAEPGDKHPFTSRAGTAEFREAYARWVVAAVSRFRGRGYLWELWNEPNHDGFWKPKPRVADYVALAKTAGAALRKAGLLGRDGEALVGPATSTIALPFLEECFKAGLLADWDAVSVHPYRQQGPENVAEEYRKLRVLIDRHAPRGKRISIISGEWGYSDVWTNHDRERQAKYVSRQFLTNLANDIPLSIWYDWRDDGTDPKEPEHHFGLVGPHYHAERDPVYEPKPAYTAVKSLIEPLRGFRFNKALATTRPQASLLVFTRGEEVRLAAWNPDPQAQGGDVAVAASDGIFKRIGHLGQALPDVAAKDGTVRLPLDDAVSIWIPTAPNDVLRVAAAWEKAPVFQPVHNGAPAAIALELRNPLERPLRVGDRELRAGETMEFRTPIAATRMDRVDDATSRLEFVVDGRRVAYAQLTRVAPDNPVTLVRYPRINDDVPVRVVNPSGDAFHGTLAAAALARDPAGAGEKRQMSLPVRLGHGERERLVMVPVGREQAGAEKISLHDAEGRELAACIVKNEFAVPFAADQVRAFGDGAPGTKVEHRFADAAPPEGPPLPGMRCLRLNYRFNAGWSFLQLNSAGPIAGRELGLWLHGDGRGAQPRIRLRDKTGQVFQADGPKIDWTGWRYITFPLRRSEEVHMAHWGGANDGVMHGPLELDAFFLLDNISREPLEGELYLSAPTVIE